jgi:hypothetical protein
MEKKKLNWALYLIAQEAMMTGFHEISQKSLSKIQSKLENDVNLEWVTSLQLLSSAENNLAQKEFEITKSVQLLISAVRSIESCSSILKAKFQMEMLNLRIEFLEISNQILVSMNLINQFNEKIDIISKKIFEKLNHSLVKLFYKFEKISTSYFDIDNEGESFIQTQKYLCSIMIRSVSFLIDQTENFKDFQNIEIEGSNSLIEFSNKIDSNLNSNLKLFERCQLLKEIVINILQRKLTIPRYYFQTKSTFNVQLEFEIDNNFYNGKIIQTTIEKSIVIKASGLITFPKQIKRNVKSVNIFISTLKDQMIIGQPEKLIIENISNSFSCLYILKFNEVGPFLVSIKISLVDEDDREWETSCETNIKILVKSQEITQRLTFL